jgi:hypothetical protein
MKDNEFEEEKRKWKEVNNGHSDLEGDPDLIDELVSDYPDKSIQAAKKFILSIKRDPN